MSLRTSLAATAAGWRQINAPPGAWLIEEFLARKGLACITQPLPRKYPQMQPRACFHNAALLVRRRAGLRFCEGYVVRDNFPLPLLHAWAIDWDDRVIDPTLEQPEHCQYLGYPMSLATRKRWIKPPGNISVFDTGSGVNFKFMLHECPELFALIEPQWQGFMKIESERRSAQ